MTNLFFKVKVGFGANDFISVDQEDYPKAVRAQVTGKVAIFKNGETASGSSIQTILPDHSRSLGYKREYEVALSEVPKKLLVAYEEFGKKVQLGLEGEIPKKLN